MDGGGELLGHAKKRHVALLSYPCRRIKMVGIISNNAAMFAQNNLRNAQEASSRAVAQLSSGNRIVYASQDVAGLAVGTVLKTNVSTLKMITTSASQALSMLSIADGGLQNIGDILQRQKALSVQSNSGSLSDNERAFLNEEFKNLKSEINRIVEGTAFNGIKMLDGSISGMAGIRTALDSLTTKYEIDNVADYSVSGSVDSSSILASGSTIGVPSAIGAAQASATLLFGTANFTAGDSVDINGVSLVAGTDFTVGGSLSASVENLYDVLAASTNTSLTGLGFSFDGTATITVTNRDAGTVGNAVTIAADLTGGTTDLNVNAAGAAQTVNTTLAGGTDTTVSTFDQNLQGSISNLSATFISGTATDATDGFIANAVRFTAEINGVTYVSQDVSLAGGTTDGAGVGAGTGINGFGDKIAANTVLTFTNPAGLSTDPAFTLTLGSTNTTLAATTVAGANTELSSLSADMLSALDNGNVTIGLNAPSTTFQSFSVNSISDYGGQGTAASGYNLNGSVSVPATIGDVAEVTTVDLGGNVAAGNTITIGGTTVTIRTAATGAANEVVVSAVTEDTAGRELATALNASTDANLSKYTYSYDTATDILRIAAKDAGTANEANVTASLAGAEIITVATAATDRTAPSSFPSSLLGGMTGFDAVFTAGAVDSSNNQLFTANTVKFIASVGGVQYESQAITLSGGNTLGGNTVGDGSGYNGLGNRIVGGQQITFVNPLDDTQPGFAITIDSDGFTLSGSSLTQVQSELKNLAEGFETSLGNGGVSITQSRELSSIDIAQAGGTPLNGVSASNIKITSSDFDAAGNLGQVGQFNVDYANNTISVEIDGRNYSQVLSDPTASGGLGTRYDSVNKIILGGFDTTLTLRSTDDTADSRQLTINLQGVSNININGAANADALENVLNDVFQVGDKNALNFQVGIDSSDRITLRLDDISTQSLYKDANGAYQDLDIGTAEGAAQASDVLDLAITLVTSARASVGALQSRFEFAQANLETSIQNQDAARGDFLDANIEEVSTEFATKQVQSQAAIAMLANTNQQLQSLLKLIG